MSAQTIGVRGTVTDGTGESLIGVTVQVLGLSTGTVTDIDGNYMLPNVPSNAILEISYVGMHTQTIPVNGRTTINVVMEEDTETLEELVVIGYGSVKKSSLTSAVSSMNSKGIENRPLARAETALQGQLAGVTVRTVTGEPGADLQIRAGSTHKKIRKDSVINNLSVWLLITCVVLRQCKCVSLPQKRHDKSSHFFAPVF